MVQIYENGTYLKDHPSWHEEDSPWKAKNIHKIIEKNFLTPTKICDIGCGTGEILKQLSEQYGSDKKFVGYEISPQAYELCNKKTKNNLSFRLLDLVNHSDEYFDVVMAIDVFEHIEDYFSFLRKIKNKGEYKIFHIPLDLSVQTVLRSSPISRKRTTAGHIHYFTKETALESLKHTGYQIIDYVYTGSYLELPSRSWKTTLMKFPRKLAFSINQDLAVRLLGGYSLLVLAK
ncbi:class I SAM-dependent methyltransferase [Acaryochloris sp. IP29b_bin.148]|uniref:class I SAM-dependent methyltransferase n=1 Tax=Acaryochloris sp. IP29b_bin.148 TaxID=2969218 RepID=UPI00262794F5|nr:class I SAM-dependent methyltransferase [Acaryochloris sp. IP29b_bin.148]